MIVSVVIAVLASGAGPFAAPERQAAAGPAGALAPSDSTILSGQIPQFGGVAKLDNEPSSWADGCGPPIGPNYAWPDGPLERLPTVVAADQPGLPAGDPLLANYYDPFGNQFVVGPHVAQPYRLNWYSYDDFTYIPTSPTRGVTGSFQDLQWNAWMRTGRTFANRHLFTWTPTWNSSFWTGPTGVALPPDVDQIRSDFQVSSLYQGRWNWQAGFTPQINADFRRSLNSNAYMFDGRFVLFYQASEQWRLAFGAAYWNRVTDLIIPYGGVIWTPNDRWELRLLFPKARLSRYWGRVWGKQLWTYGSLGYDLQAWQVEIEDATRAKTRMQMSSNQALVGATMQWGRFNAFAEGGLIFDRHVRFRGPTPSFGIQDTLMLRIGAMY